MGFFFHVRCLLSDAIYYMYMFVYIYVCIIVRTHARNLLFKEEGAFDRSEFLVLHKITVHMTFTYIFFYTGKF